MRSLWGSAPECMWVFCDGSTGVAEEVGGSDLASPRMTCGAGAVALSESGRILGWEWEILPVMTNNEAEYMGLLLGLRLAARLRAQETICLLDSAVVVGQMEGRFSVNSPTLRRWHWQASELARTLPAVRFLAIPRQWNRLADGLACQASIPWEQMRRVIAAQGA